MSFPEPVASVSIVVCLHNEAFNADVLVNNLISQSYHGLSEIIFVDDWSTDKTYEVIASRLSDDSRIRLLRNPSERGKKQALQYGISSARSEWVLLTDADCTQGPEWARTMMQKTTASDIDIVLGYSPCIPKGSMVSNWVHFESWIVGLLYLSFAKRGMPYMGVGRNLLYRKAIYSEKHFQKYKHLVSGDDDLTIMQLATADNTNICLDPKSIVWTSCPDSWGSYYRQKRRHFSTAVAYKWHHQLLLGMYPASQIFFFLFLFLLGAKLGIMYGLALLVLRYMVIVPVALALQRSLISPMGWVAFIFMDFVQSFYYIIFIPALIFPKKKTWI